MQFRVKLGGMKPATKYRQKSEDAARVQRDPDDDAPRTRQGTRTDLRRDTSRSPERTGLRCAGQNAPSQCELVTGPSFSSPNQPDQEWTTAYRASGGPESRSDAHCATIVGDWVEPYGESQ